MVPIHKKLSLTDEVDELGMLLDGFEAKQEEHDEGMFKTPPHESVQLPASNTNLQPMKSLDITTLFVGAQNQSLQQKPSILQNCGNFNTSGAGFPNQESMMKRE